MTGGKLAVEMIAAWIERRRRRKMLKGKLTYSGIAVTGVALVLGWLGIADDGSATELVRVGSEFVGLLLATYGRWRATKAS